MRKEIIEEKEELRERAEKTIIEPEQKSVQRTGL